MKDEYIYTNNNGILRPVLVKKSLSEERYEKAMKRKYKTKYSEESNDIIDNPEKSTEGAVGLGIVGLIAAVIMAAFIKGKIDKAQQEKVLNKIKPFIDEIAQELHNIYINYTEAIKLIVKFNLLEKLKKMYDTIIIRKSDFTIKSEEEFIKIILPSISEDIHKILKKQPPKNYCDVDLAWGGFDMDAMYSNVPEDEWGKFEENYFSRFYELLIQITKIVKNKIGDTNIEFLFDMAGDDMAWDIWFRVKYNLSKELIQKLIDANKKHSEESNDIIDNPDSPQLESESLVIPPDMQNEETGNTEERSEEKYFGENVVISPLAYYTLDDSLKHALTDYKNKIQETTNLVMAKRAKYGQKVATVINKKDVLGEYPEKTTADEVIPEGMQTGPGLTLKRHYFTRPINNIMYRITIDEYPVGIGQAKRNTYMLVDIAVIFYRKNGIGLGKEIVIRSRVLRMRKRAQR
jgi:hypothetical protein